MTVATDLDIPVLDGLQRQGDVFIIPTRNSKAMLDAATPIPAEGIPVVRGEAGGNTHLLIADGEALWLPNIGRDAELGVIVIPRGTVCYLLHPEHGGMAIAPGTYRTRRQREQADEERLVAD